MTEELMLTRNEAARKAGVPVSTIRLWIQAGLLHPVGPDRIGNGHRAIIRATELDRMLERRSQHLQGWAEVWA